jgi:hypothetical protein
MAGRNIPADMEMLRQIIYSSNKRNRERTDSLIEIAQNGLLDAESMEAVARFGPGEIGHFLRKHPGHKLDQAISSLWNMLEVFRCACKGIQRENENLRSLAAESKLSHPRNESRIDEIQNEIRKEIFAASGAAFALVDLSRRVFPEVEVPGYKERIEDDFSQDGEHHFIQGLRNSMSHSWFAPAGWSVSYAAASNELSTSFQFDCEQMLSHGKFDGMAQKYLENAGKYLDVEWVFASYSKKVEGLYGWLSDEIQAHLPEKVLEYRRCMREQKVYVSRCMWRVLIDQVAIPNAIDPYDHLSLYLTEEQLEEVLALPDRSKEQVDRIIELVDEYEACTEDLRNKVYELFAVED